MIAGSLVTDCEYLLTMAAEKLRRARIASPRREARLLLAHAMGISADKLIADKHPVTPQQSAGFEALIERRTKYEPVAYLTESKEFWSLEFTVGPGVLIPRPETETLVEAALRQFPDRDARLRVLDLGTGSGCLLLAFLSERPNASGIGIDQSEAALAIAERNAKALSLHGRAEFQPGNWTAGVVERFDVILTNPPYISTGELAHLAPDIGFEPRSALNGGVDGLSAYRCIAAGLASVLAPTGMAFVEIGQGQADGVQQIFAAAKLKLEGTACDLAGIPRCVRLRAG